ncbi:MAG: glycosyltransferase [Planctomycetia bacterium]|nr:glycosyltransferase [Planctomycetia bacterium]
MAIIHLISNLNPNGNTSQLLALLKAGEITEERHIFTFSPILPKFRAELESVFMRGNVQVHELRIHFPTETFWLLRHYFRRLRLHPVVIHVWDERLLQPGYHLAQLFHARTIATLRHWSTEFHFQKRIFSRYDHLVTNSVQLMRKREEEGYRGNWHVIYDTLPDMLETSENMATFPSRETFRTELGLPSESVLAVCVGPVAEWKRWQWAVWTIDSIVRVHPEMHLLFLDPDLENASLRHLDTIGGQEKKQERERRAVGTFIKQYEREALVHFVPYRKDWRRILPLMDYFWNIQTLPGAGLATLEAAAAGVPIISSRAGATEDIFPENSVTLLSESPETTELASKTHCLWINTARSTEQIAIAQEIARKHDNLTKFSLEYKKLYE